jgi:two-component system CheB/CheR fusion protein
MKKKTSPRRRKAVAGSTSDRRPPKRHASASHDWTAPEPRADGESHQEQPAVAAEDAELAPRGPSFPVVGIGASAGGLEALEAFLRHVPEDSGMAFVIVQHLDPGHKGSLVELLQRPTNLPVVQVKDGVKVEPNHVYVIPPGKDLSISGGELHLSEQTLPRGLHLPIDFFLRSLAEDGQHKSIGVILSGMGTDGTLGLRALKEKAGTNFVQSPSSAKFDGMPRSAIDAGLADVIAPAEELPARIVAYRKHAPHIAGRGEAFLEHPSQSAMEQVFSLLRSQTGNDFSLYKESTIQRRIERRMALHQIAKISAYVRFLRERPREIELLFRELLIGVTSFFRDASAWDYLRNQALPAFFAHRDAGDLLRAWVPGCSTGEEAYSLAMTFREAIDSLKPEKNLALQIYATDLDADAIERARLGIYPSNIAQDVSADRLRRFFVQDERNYRVSKEIRDMVVFAPQNLIMDPPFTKLDILSCRNLLIYLGPELQKKLIPLFHYALNRDGLLFLGSAETIGTYSGLFAPLEGKARLYRRLEAGIGTVPVEFPVAFGAARPTGHHERGAPEESSGRPALNLPTLVGHVLVQHFAPAAVLTTEKGEILYVSGRTGKYLEPAVGKASVNIFAMARQGLRLELSSAFAEALREKRPAIVRGISVGTNGGTQMIDLTVQRLTEPKELRGTMLVVFTDRPSKKGHDSRSVPRMTNSRMEQLAKELQRAQDEIQTTREEMQTSQEELKSTNEELQSTNEELQSTNEELTTSKEEMQSMNEELQTVNHELHAKLEELSRSNNDMKNLLNSTDIATLFLDGNLRVRRFTTPIASIIKLIPSDVGRPIGDITRDVDYPDLVDDAREVLRTLVYKDKLVSATQNRLFAVRIMPYRTVDNVIDGVVITFTDAAVTKTLETTLRQQASELRQMAESLPHLVLGWRPDGACDYVSPQWTQYTGLAASELLGHGWWVHAVAPEDRERVRSSWQVAVNTENPWDAEFRIRSKEGAVRWFKARAVPIRDAVGKTIKWYGTALDVDDLKRTTEDRKMGEHPLEHLLQGISDPVFTLASDGTMVQFNDAAQHLVGRRPDELLGKKLVEVLPSLNKGALGERLRVWENGAPGPFDVDMERGGHVASFQVRLGPSVNGLVVVLLRANARPEDEQDGEARRRESA